MFLKRFCLHLWLHVRSKCIYKERRSLTQAAALRFLRRFSSRCLSVLECARVSEELQRLLGARDLLLAALRAFGLTWRDNEGAPVVLAARREPRRLPHLRWSILLIFGPDRRTPTALILSALSLVNAQLILLLSNLAVLRPRFPNHLNWKDWSQQRTEGHQDDKGGGANAIDLRANEKRGLWFFAFCECQCAVAAGPSACFFGSGNPRLLL